MTGRALGLQNPQDEADPTGSRPDGMPATAPGSPADKRGFPEVRYRFSGEPDELMGNRRLSRPSRECLPAGGQIRGRDPGVEFLLA